MKRGLVILLYNFGKRFMGWTLHMIMCVLLCYPVSIRMSQLQSTGHPISSYTGLLILFFDVVCCHQVGFSLRKVNRHVDFPLLLDIAPYCSVLSQVNKQFYAFPKSLTPSTLQMVCSMAASQVTLFHPSCSHYRRCNLRL